MTPNDIEVLIHCHCVPAIHPRIDAPAVAGAIRMLELHGLIEKHGGEEFYRTTDRGVAHMKQLCSISYPIKKWFDANGNVIDE